MSRTLIKSVFISIIIFSSVICSSCAYIDKTYSVLSANENSKYQSIYSQDSSIMDSSIQGSSIYSSSQAGNSIYSKSQKQNSLISESKITGSRISSVNISRIASAEQQSSSNSSSSSDEFDLPRPGALKRGLNLYFLLGGYETYAIDEKYYRIIKDAGFDHVRLAVNFNKKYGLEPNYIIDEYFLFVIDTAIQNAIKQGLIVILDMHFDDLSRNPADSKMKFLDFWKQLSNRYKSYPGNLYFEILNEPNSKLTESLWNIYLNEAISVIRQKNPYRMIVVGPVFWNTAPLEGLDLPKDDKKIIVTIHCYTPLEFTQQGVEWITPQYPVGVAWTWNYASQIITILDKAQQWAVKNNRMVWLGEFGVYHLASNEAKIKYMSFVSRECEKRDIAWAYWEFCFSFGLYDIDKATWSEGLLKALVPDA